MSPFRVSLVAMALIDCLGLTPCLGPAGRGRWWRIPRRGLPGGLQSRVRRPWLQPWLRWAALRLQPWLRRSPFFWASFLRRASCLRWPTRLCRAGLRRAAAVVVVATATMVGLGTAALVGGLPLVKTS